MKIIELNRHEQLSLSLPDCQRLANNQIGFANNYSKTPKSSVNIGSFHTYGQIKNYMKLSWHLGVTTKMPKYSISTPNFGNSKNF